MIPLADARRVVFDACPPPTTAVVAIDDARGCVLAAPVVAGVSVPSFANSAVDGYAVRAADLVEAPVELVAMDTVMAGSEPVAPVAPGHAMRIMTGAPLPVGADAVCMVEDSDPADGGRVLLRTSLPVGANIRLPGEDVVAGQELFVAGEVLAPAHIGVLASVGIDRLAVHPRLRVGVLSTGDEVVPCGEPLAPGKVWDANRPLLVAAVRDAGFDAVDLGVAPDDERSLTDVLLRAAERCDAVVTSGGVSMGDRDAVKVVLANLAEGAMRWMQVAIKPAKPFAFGILTGSGCPVFGLPGNPVSSLVSFEILARPALRRMAGHRRIDRPTVTAAATSALTRRRDGKTHFARVTVRFDGEQGFRVAPVDGQQSHQLHALAQANGLAVLPDGTGVVAGGLVEVLLLDAEGAVGSEADAGWVRTGDGSALPASVGGG